MRRLCKFFAALLIFCLPVCLLADQFAETTSLGTDLAPRLMIPGGWGMGTCFAVTSDGFIVTADHVVNETQDYVVKVNGRVYHANLIDEDKVNDVALLRIYGLKSKMSPVTLQKDITVGETVASIGFPIPDESNFTPKLTLGSISNLNGYTADLMSDSDYNTTLFQVSILIDAGNSGGPLFNSNGEVVGIADAVFADNGHEIDTHALFVKSSIVIALLEKNHVSYKSPHIWDNFLSKVNFGELYNNSGNSVFMILGNIRTQNSLEAMFKNLAPLPSIYLLSDGVKITEYYSPTCSACAELNQEIISEGLNNRYSITRVNVDNLSDSQLQTLGIVGIPVTDVSVNGRHVDRIVGYISNLAERLQADTGK